MKADYMITYVRASKIDYLQILNNITILFTAMVLSYGANCDGYKELRQDSTARSTLSIHKALPTYANIDHHSTKTPAKRIK